MVKKYKRNIADAVHAKKSAANDNPFATARPSTSKRLNPFEVHVNREKFQILGRTCKHDKGLPGVSRGKAIQKRKETIGKEYQVKHKTNKFHDKRIGRHLHDDELTDEILNARFIADRMGQSKTAQKASRFNLDDTEVLTHRGQTLEEIEQFHDDRSDDEDLNDETLDASFTEAAHFGGAESESAQAKDRQTAIEEMIIEQKRRKVEIAKEKDEIHELTEKLDSNYKQLIGIMGKTTKKDLKEIKSNDDYDKIMREMLFEPRGRVADKLITEEELAKKEKERLELLENERLRRMNADEEDGDNINERPKHRSADDLDDGYFANGDIEEDTTLTYTMDGELGTKINGQINGDAHDGGGENDDEASSGSEDEDDENVENDEDSDDEGSEEESDNDNDDLSDLKITDSETESEHNAELEIEKTTKSSKSHDEPKEKAIAHIVRTDIPFTIEMPDLYKEFYTLISKHVPEDQALIVERLIKCNHPKIDAVNREKVVKLFTFLMQYINDVFAEANETDIHSLFKMLAHLTPHLYDLVQLEPDRMSVILLNVIKEKHANYRKNSKQYPPLETVIFFKLVSNFYSTSDFRHPVVTPCYIFIQHILSKAKVRTRQDIAIGLFLVTTVLEYAQLSKRILPAALNFLLGIVYLSIPKRPIEVTKILPPFQSTGYMNKLLAISVDATENFDKPETLLNAEDLVTTTLTVEFKIKALNMCLRLIKDAMELYKDIVGSNFLALPLLEMLDRTSLEHYPQYVRDNFVNTKAILEEVAQKPMKKLVPPEKKPKALRLLEPRFETVYDDKRRPKVSQEKEEKLKLLHKIKRETKGAIREIRRDTGFLQKMRIKQQIQSDIERKEKVKRIYQEASVQQGELNELERAKKRKKF